MVQITNLLTKFANACEPANSFLGIPTWYKYLPGEETTETLTQTTVCTPQLNSLADVWLIGAAILDILLRLAALLAVFYIVFAGVKYIQSQGQPDQTKKAKDALVNAIVGLVIAVTAAVLVSFIAGRFK
jgi:hypothetical protein